MSFGFKTKFLLITHLRYYLKRKQIKKIEKKEKNNNRKGNKPIPR